jgi:hypothetical protein
MFWEKGEKITKTHPHQKPDTLYGVPFPMSREKGEKKITKIHPY